MSNGYFSAYATSRCSSALIDAAVHITSKKDNLYFSVRSAGLYNFAGGLVTSTGIQGLTPLWEGYLYATALKHVGWYHTAPYGGSTVKFYVDTPSTVVVGVPVACHT